MTSRAGRRVTLWSLIAILALAAGLRTWGCFGQGYPRCYYGDEYTNIERALRYGSSRSPDPGGWFNKPAMGFYVLLVEYGAYYGYGRATGKWDNAFEFGVAYFADQGPFLLIGRLSTALFGVLTVLLAFKLARSLFGRGAGLLAALMLAVTLGHVASSQQVKMDVPAAFWNTWCALALVSIMRRGRYRDYVWAGLLAGLGMATKYYSLVMIIAIGLAHILREPAALARVSRFSILSGWTKVLVSAGTLFLGFFIGSPYNTLDGWWQGRFWSLLKFSLGRIGITLGEAASPRGPLVTDDHSIWDSFVILLGNLGSPAGAGFLITGFAAVGCVVCVIGRKREYILLLGVASIMLAASAVANRQLPLPRHLNILYPMVAILGAVGVQGVSGLLAARFRPWLVGAAVAAVLLPISLFPLGDTLDENRRRMIPDPRNRVLDWMEENIADGAVVINDHGRAALVPDQFRCEWVIRRLGVLKRRSVEAIARAKTREDKERGAREIQWHSARLAKLQDQLTKWDFRSHASASYSGSRYDSVELLHVWQTEELAERPFAAGDYNPTWPRSPWGELFDQVAHRLGVEGVPLTEASMTEALERRLVEDYVRIGVNRVRVAARRKGEVLTLPQLEERTRAELEREWAAMGGEWPVRRPSPVEMWRRVTPVSRAWLTWQEEGAGVVYRPVQFFISTRKSYANYAADKVTKRRNFFDWAALYDDLEQNYDSWDFNLNDADEARVIRIWDLRTRKPGAARRTRVW